MGLIVDWMDRSLYPNYGRRWDDTAFREKILGSLSTDSVVLEIGAGRGGKSQMDFRGLCKTVAGVDMDSVVQENPYLDEAHVLDASQPVLPFPDRYFDGVYCNSVIEHVSDRDFFFSEVFRVLKPGGWFWAKTPNRNHYVARIAQLTPDWFHKYYNSLRGTETRDIFPTTYACNTPREVRSAAKQHGFELVSLDVIEGRPEYLRLAWPMYLAGYLYERVVNSLPALAWLRCVMMFQLQKPAGLRS